MIKLLAKADDAVLSHCRCAAPIASLPGQLDCPWCGWLICCTDCRKAFTYACVVEVETDYETFVREDRRRGGLELTDEEVSQDAETLEWMLEPFSPGDKIVYLDGVYFAIDEPATGFQGLYARHDLRKLPHASALKSPEQLGAILGDKFYWLDRERPDRNSDG